MAVPGRPPSGASRALHARALAAALLSLHSVPSQAGAGLGPTLRAGSLAVTLDSALPRPAEVVYRGTNLTAAASPGPPGPEPPPPDGWWLFLDNVSLVTAQGAFGCHEPTCTSYSLPEGTTNTAGAVACNKSCHMSDECDGWDMIKVTPTSGQRGKAPLCQRYSTGGLAGVPPFYRWDTNFACGTKKQLQPIPPAPAGPGAGELLEARSCVNVVAVNGSLTSFCAAANETETRYTGAMGHGRNWTTVLRKSSPSIEVILGGTVSVAATSSRGAINASELVWRLLSATSADVEVRAVDLGYGFAGLDTPDAVLLGTHQEKTWCPDGAGCQEWAGGLVSCRIGTTCTKDDFRGQLLARGELPTSALSASRWPKPPLPWAFSALLAPGRSSFAAGFSPAAGVGYAAWSSQITLPMRNYGSYGEIGADGTSTLRQFSTGAARLNIALRCGDVLPLTVKIGFFGDISGDGKVSQDDAIIYAREQYPRADSVYRGGILVKLDNDITSYRQQEGLKRISFNDTLEVIKSVSMLADNATIVMTLVGWQGSGHDTL